MLAYALEHDRCNLATPGLYPQNTGLSHGEMFFLFPTGRASSHDDKGSRMLVIRLVKNHPLAPLLGGLVLAEGSYSLSSGLENSPRQAMSQAFTVETLKMMQHSVLDLPFQALWERLLDYAAWVT